MNRSWKPTVTVGLIVAATILIAPLPGHASPASVSAERALTYDSTRREKKDFSPDERILYAILVRVSDTPAELDVSWKVNNNSRTIYSHRQKHNFQPGYHAVYSPSAVPSDSAGLYVNSVTIKFGSRTINRQSSFTVAAGRVCMFYAPASIISEEVGHVGWAFRQTAGDRWEFGGTEYIRAQDNWIKTGTWRDVLTSFQSPPVRASRYTTYRCLDWPKAWMDPVAADKTARAASSRPYTLTIDNCLTRSVEVFNAYGLSLPPGELEYPRHYFESLSRTTEGVNAPTKWSPLHRLR